MQGGHAGEALIRPGHAGTRTTLRVLGPLVIAAALVVGAFGLYYLVALTDTEGMDEEGWFDETISKMVRDSLLFVLATILFAAGAAMTWFGYMGAVSRYAASEVTPVGVDAIDYAAPRTAPAMTAMGTAFGTGMAAARGSTVTVLRCHKCNADNLTSSQFCNACGTALAKTKACPKCGERNDPDARFCDDCGARMT